uniref:U18-lycotoxin-Ls1a n=1 Tax=Lycosa singoriensis TaxID=434756 RepID=TX20B_LYCSI|nr:RecName: Full=U18-lycotoxin-Ls1a; Short=U18-LCTX-Ls1a; AltName: Full=Toxin-like structure LSTX-P4; Flags: Precursor [Lycosa singoriensis]ACI41471.1 toxin-like structure LSTX-P4 precursor [Lycosa singoriensis]CAS03740.1 toxin-like structure LSTX-P4 precursor [Lycosa singoriensis]
MSPKMQALLLLLGLITLLVVHAEEELSENTESERGCIKLNQECVQNKTPCCNNRPCLCYMRFNICLCEKPLGEIFGR